jgi:hypothetical protein
MTIDESQGDNRCFYDRFVRKVRLGSFCWVTTQIRLTVKYQIRSVLGIGRMKIIICLITEESRSRSVLT